MNEQCNRSTGYTEIGGEVPAEILFARNGMVVAYESRGPSLTRLAPHTIDDDIIGDPSLAAGRVS